MSSPVNEEHHDKRTMYAPPWARETAKQSPDAIIAEVEQLRLERQRAAAAAEDAMQTGPRERDDNQTELPLAGPSDPVDIEAEMADAVRAGKWAPRTLDPVLMAEPPPRLDGPTWGMVARLGGAVTAAAIVALFVTGALRLPQIDISLGSRESARAEPSIALARVVDDTQLQRPTTVVADASSTVPLPPDTAAAPSPILPPPAIVAPAAATASNALPKDVLTAYASLDTQPSATSLKAKGDGVQAPAGVTPKLGELRAMDRDELAGLVKRGQALLGEGDIASARLLLRRAAEAGDAEAALMLATTYDRAELAKLKVIGVAPDHAQAKAWYTKAVEHGSAEAVRRLQQLAQRGD
jgi:hypothetical protein